jgi:hypothetical protein
MVGLTVFFQFNLPLVPGILNFTILHKKGYFFAFEEVPLASIEKVIKFNNILLIFKIDKGVAFVALILALMSYLVIHR